MFSSNEIDDLLDAAFDESRKSCKKDEASKCPQEEKRTPDTHRRSDRRRSLSPALTDAQRDKRTVFIHQLSQKVTSSILQEFCEKAGPVRQVKMVSDKMSKRSKGVAYVEFRQESSVPNAVSMTGQKLLGVPIIIEITETEKNRLAEEAAELT